MGHNQPAGRQRGGAFFGGFLWKKGLRCCCICKDKGLTVEQLLFENAGKIAEDDWCVFHILLPGLGGLVGPGWLV
jgi:hypothetical protein